MTRSPPGRGEGLVPTGSWKAPFRFLRMHRDHEPVGRVTPCAPQFGNAQTARRGLTRPTFMFMESPVSDSFSP